MRPEWVYATIVALIIVFMATSYASTPPHTHEYDEGAEMAPEPEPFSGRYKILSVPDHRR